jgi:hypothetical protein
VTRSISVRSNTPIALREFDYGRELFPQFGDRIRDLSGEEGQIRFGIIRPLSMRYSVYEARRLVLYGVLPILLPMVRSDAEANAWQAEGRAAKAAIWTT